jgi:DNA-binding transcriptional LysR family regulator
VTVHDALGKLTFMLDVRRLRVLHQVAVHGSLAGAARALAFTPSAVSQQIAALEREVGMPLLERLGRGVQLTDAGAALVERTEAILGELARAEADLAAVSERRAGVLRIGAFPSSGYGLVPAAVLELSERFPGVELRLVELEPEESVPLLRLGELDLAIAFECDYVPLTLDAGFEAVTLDSEPMLLIDSKEHSKERSDAQRTAQPAAEAHRPARSGLYERSDAQRTGKVDREVRRAADGEAGRGGSAIGEADRYDDEADGLARPLDLADVAERSWIVPNPGSAIHEFTVRACQAAGFEPRIASVWNDFRVVQTLVAAGLGVAFVPRLALSDAPPVSARPVRGEPSRRILAVWRAGTARAPLAEAVTATFGEVARNLSP